MGFVLHPTALKIKQNSPVSPLHKKIACVPKTS